ncbi:hypothetical protein [Cohnella sp. GbtcB17]|uniref:hypothetical protein n=1 Tax=Cohnella sp. GbtcB17 TaxID=2824762 RepID=UPI001C2FEE44|nr:hypothetical protein [Cohnella sp. GbtcB17]
MDGVSFDLAEIFKGMDFANERVQKAVARGVEKAVEDLHWDSVHLAPILTGDLRSHSTFEVKIEGTRVTGEVRYSAISTSKSGWKFDYALHLHEMPRIVNPSKPGTGPKFLSRPLKAKRRRYEQMIIDEIRKELR